MLALEDANMGFYCQAKYITYFVYICMVGWEQW